MQPTLARHSRVGKAEGELARVKPGAIYFMAAPAARKALQRVGIETTADDRSLSSKEEVGQL